MRRFPIHRGTQVALGLLLAMACFLAAFPASAADPRTRLERLQRRQQALDRKIDAANERKGALLGRIEVVDEDRAAVEDTVAALDSEISALDADIAETAGRLEAAQKVLAGLELELEGILARLDRRTDVMTERAVAAYKAGPSAYVDGLLSSQSFGELIDRYAYYESILEADSGLLEEIEALRGETEAKRRVVEAKEEEIAAAKRQLEQDKAQVAAVRAERAQALASLEQVLTEKKSLLSSVESRKKTYIRVQDQLESESNDIQNLLAARAAAAAAAAGPAPSGGTSTGAGNPNAQFAWPAPGPVTSPFGYRTHPIFGDSRLHTGIDIGAPYGATVIAGGDGIVAFTGVMSGYGNVVVVDHGGGLATTYNHLSAFSVASGQSVGRAQPVGAVGCTGYCTGPHLHFEVRVNGSPVDPMPYLQ